MVNSAKFATESPTAQTATLAKADGLPILFVPTFVALSDKRMLRDKLLSGVDVSMDLEFNGIELTEEERAALKAVLPVLEKIGAIGPAYPWLPETDFSDAIKFELNNSRIRRAGHSLKRTAAEAVWKRASKKWSGAPGAIPTHRVPADGSDWSNKDVNYRSDSVTIGCQTISRAEVEYIARHYGWDPVVYEA